MSCALYLAACEDAEKVSEVAVVKRLQRVCILLDVILQSDRSRYLEARTWLLNSIASQTPPADVRLACWEPLLSEALATPQERTTPSTRYHSNDDAADDRRRHESGEALGRAGRRSSPDGRDPDRNAGGAGDLAAAGAAAGPSAGPVGAVPGPMELLTQLLMLVSEVWPDKVTSLLLDLPQLFVDFFQGPGSSRRILMWFSHFSMDGMRAFKYGSHALAHYALVHREEMWDLLRWEGKHPQAPVAVAAKTHYFCELALVPSVRSLLRHHPRFWASEQWRECCRDGAVLELDRRHFCEMLLKELHSGDRGNRDGPSSGAASVGARLAALLRDFLSAPSPPGALPTASHPHWQLLCQRLLHQLHERQLLRLINTLAAGQRLQPPPSPPPPAAAAAGPSGPAGTSGASGTATARPAATALARAYATVCGEGGWQDLGGLVLRGGVEWGSVAEAVLAHALAAARGPLQRLLGEEREELAGRLEEVERLARELHGAPGAGAGAGGGAERDFGAAEGCEAAAHSALLYGGLLEVAGPGRRCAKDRLLLLAELWTLREALHRAKPPWPSPATAIATAAGRAQAAPLPSSAVAAPGAVVHGVGAGSLTGPGGGGDDGDEGCGDAVARLPLERVMAELGGMTFARVKGGTEEGVAGRRGLAAKRGTLPSGATPPRAAAGSVAEALFAGGVAAANAAAAVAGQYDLLPSEGDEEEQGRPGGSRRRREREESRGRSRRASRGSKKRHRDADGRHKSRRGRKHRKRKQRRRRSRGRSESPGRDRSRSRSGSRGRARDSSGSSGSGDEWRRRAKERRMKRKQHWRRREARTPSSRSSGSGSTSSWEDNGSGLTTTGSGSSSGEDEEQRKAGCRERCGSSGLEDRENCARRVSRRDSSRRRRSRRGLLESCRSSALDGGQGAEGWYGGRRIDSDDLKELDPLALLRGEKGVAAWGDGGCGQDSRDTVWRVRLPRGISGGGAGAGSSAAAPAVEAEAALDVEVVGGCNDVADLLAAVACKHWLAALLQRRCWSGYRRRAEVCAGG